MTAAVGTGARVSSLGLFLGLVGVLCAIEIWIVARPLLQDELALISMAVTVDLLAGIPLLGFLFLVRRARLSPWLLLPLVVVSFGIAYLIVPAEHRQLLGRLELLLPLVELALIVQLVIRIRRVVRAYRVERKVCCFASEALEAAFERGLGSRVAASAITGELLTLLYAVTGWFRSFVPGDARHFAYHRAAGYPAFLAMMSGLVVAEVVVVHVALLTWSETAAWIMSALGIYGLLWFVGDFHAMRLHPVLMDDTTLHLRCGLRWRARVRREEIISVSAGEPGDRRHKLSLAPFGGADLWIELASPVTVHGLFGLRREARFLGLTVEDGQGFQQSLLPPSDQS